MRFQSAEDCAAAAWRTAAGTVSGAANARLAADGRGVQLTVEKLQPGYVYEITPKTLAEKPLFPDTAHYTVNRVP